LWWVRILDVTEHEPRAFAFCVEANKTAVMELCVVEQSECSCGKSKAERPVGFVEDVEDVFWVGWVVTKRVVGDGEHSDSNAKLLAQTVNGLINAFAVSDVNSQAVAEALFEF